MSTTLDGFTATALVRHFMTYGTVMLGVGLTAVWMLRRRPARRHAALLLSLVAALVVPVAAEVARQADIGLLSAVTVTRAAPPTALDVVAAVMHDADTAYPTVKERLEAAGGQVFGDYLTRYFESDEGQKDFGRDIDSVWLAVVAPFWCLLSGIIVVRTLVAAWRARRLVARATDTAPEFLRAAAERAAVEAGVRRRPAVRMSSEAPSPVVWCWGRRPVIVVPAKVDGDVDWAAVMRHELAHWTRRDHLADALARCVVALVPFHPLAWAARAKLERLAERACDDWAVSGGESAAYAQSLVTLAARVRGPRLALPVARKGSDLAARVRRVLSVGRAAPRAGKGWLVGVAVTATCATALAALARHPAGEVKFIYSATPEPPAKLDAKPKEAPAPVAPQPAAPVAGNPPAKPGAPAPDRRKPAAITLNKDLSVAVKELYDLLADDGGGPVFTLAGEIAERDDLRAIPMLIGVIDSDNTYSSVYGIGYFGLSKLTGVKYDDRYDGTWWKAWWQKNKANYPAAIDTPIPAFPPTPKRIAQVYDFGEWVGLTKGEPPERILGEIQRRLNTPGEGGGLNVSDLGERLVRENGPRAIPWLIGVIDSDNTYSTIYGIGYFGLSKITGVMYDDRRDGRWWRAWWEKNKAKFPLDAQQTPIPELPKSPRHVASVYDHGQWVGEVDTEPVSRMMAEMKRRLEAGQGAHSIAQRIAERNDPSVIPEMIALIRADQTARAKYDVGHFGLSPLTGVKYDETHDGAWWVKWWNENKGRFAGRAAGELPKVDLQPPPGPAAEPGDNDAAPDVADVPQQDLHIGADANKRYYLIGAGHGAKGGEPLGLLIVLPGGDGSADFNPFIRRMWKFALPKGFVVAQAVAPKWREGDDRIVWPTEKLPDANMKFTTEQFIEEIVKDVGSKVKLDPAKVFALGWSSGGPPVYAATMREGSSIRGGFVAMSVYKPETLPPATGLKGKSFYVFHSPQDFIKMNFPRKAIEQLSAGGARTKLQEYEGGHGWKGNIWKNIRTGVEWLMAKDDAAAPASPPPAAAPAPKP